jgi:hypothetical protein
LETFCHIHIEGAEFRLHQPFKFAVVPRVGEVVNLDLENETGSEFVVYDVHHNPDGVQNLPASVVLYVRRAETSRKQKANAAI